MPEGKYTTPVLAKAVLMYEAKSVVLVRAAILAWRFAGMWSRTFTTSVALAANVRAVVEPVAVTSNVLPSELTIEEVKSVVVPIGTTTIAALVGGALVNVILLVVLLTP